jgi:hypothetical protein
MSAARPQHSKYPENISNTAILLGTFLGSGAAYFLGHPLGAIGARWQVSTRLLGAVGWLTVNAFRKQKSISCINPLPVSSSLS